MGVSDWVAVSVSGFGLVLNIAAFAVGYGMLRGTVAALGLRVTALEAEIGAIGDMKVKVAEIATRQDVWIEQLKELNASIRWMREPAGPEPIRGVTPPLPRKP